VLLSDVPGAASSTASIVNYYSSADRRRVVLVGLYLTPFAGIAFIWFIVASTPFGPAGKRSEGTARRTTGHTLFVVGPDAVPGCERGATLTFRVDGQRAAQSVLHEPGHNRSPFDLTVS
jgi:hypothetical protein